MFYTLEDLQLFSFETPILQDIKLVGFDLLRHNYDITFYIESAVV